MAGCTLAMMVLSSAKSKRATSKKKTMRDHVKGFQACSSGLVMVVVPRGSRVTEAGNISSIVLMRHRTSNIFESGTRLRLAVAGLTDQYLKRKGKPPQLPLGHHQSAMDIDYNCGSRQGYQPDQRRLTMKGVKQPIDSLLSVRGLSGCYPCPIYSPCLLG
ncbi:hypothetical protein An07g06810 [Aspergillus niger]|uniref:Uncharacterized protein n=2 Tax=Aspergillus niger TaxID=5061 RepID=A2QNS4_ASPNC|nr:hypothetical protein An07g06810 [Aspergillus niger]CAK39526.1 hypothetical protein An07g06810 [Aspergillus niger]